MKDVKPTQVGLDGGLNLKVDPTRLDPPATTRADNVWHIAPGNVAQLPGLVAQNVGSPLHVYNLCTRDPSPPASTGDVLVLGEYPDIRSQYFGTRTLWAHNNGQSLPLAGSSPYSLRIVSFGSAITQFVQANYYDQQAPMVYGSGVLCAREENGTYRGRFLAGYFRGLTSGGGTATLVGVSGNSATLADTGSFSASGGNFYIGDAIGNLGRTDASFVTANQSGTFYNNYLSFAGSFAGSTPTGSVSYSGFLPQLFNHAGRTYLGFAGPASTYVPTLVDVVAGTTSTLPTQGSTLPATVAFASPYALQTSTSTTYCACVFNRSLLVLARTAAGAWSIAAGPTALPVANTTPSGTVNYKATCAVNILDAQGGVGPNAVLLVTVFAHYPEAASNNQIGGTGGNISFQSVAVSNWRFTAANAGLLNVGNSIFRTPSGAGLVSKAFVANPSEVGPAGPAAAKQALCVVQSGSLELNFDPLYQSTSTFDVQGVRGGQATFFLINQAGEVVGRAGEENAALYNSQFASLGTYAAPTGSAAFSPCYNLSNPLFLSSSGDDNALMHIAVPVLLNTPIAVQRLVGGQPLQNRAAQSANIQPAFLNFSLPASGVPAVAAGACMYTTGALPQVHDGNQVVEQNYHFAAHNALVRTTTLTDATVTTDQYYTVAVVYNWRDEQGRTHRSAPSSPTTVKVASGNRLSFVNVYVAAPCTSRTLFSSPITAQVYVSLPNATDTRMYYVGQVVTGAITSSDFQTPTWYYNVGANYDTTTLPFQPALYTSYNATSAATYDALQPRAGFYQAVGKGRLFSLSQVAGQQRIYYSSVASDVLPFEWNPLNYAPVPPDIGDARSLEVLDDKIVALGTRLHAAMTGDGPTPTGTTNRPVPNDGFSPLTPIPTPAGVVGTGAPARIPEGIAFQGFGGIQLLGRDLANGALGAQVDPLTGRWVGTPGVVLGRAVTLPSLQSVVWPNPAGPALVYSYLTKKWSTWPLLAGATALAQRMDGTVWYALQPTSGQTLPSTCEVGVLQAGTWAPAAAASSSAAGLVVETPWVQVAGNTGGEADLTDMMLVGTWLGPHTLQVEQAYNYGTYSLSQTADMSAQPAAYQTRWRPLSTSRVWAVRYRVTLLPLTTLAAGYAMAALSDLLLYCLPKAGTTRTPAQRTR